MSERGRLYAGTSGFAYADWAPLFYDAGTRPAQMLARYSARLPAVELNNTFYQQPRPAAISGWLSATPADFRFALKAQRGGAMRAFSPAAVESVAWLTAPYRLFGNRLGIILMRAPDKLVRDDDRLATLLAAWPSHLPLALELPHPSWVADETFAALAGAGVVLTSTDLDDAPAPDLRLTGSALYLRLRRNSYSADDVRRWADRLAPFLDSGTDCFVFLRHDADGSSALRALDLSRLLGDFSPPAPPASSPAR